MKFFKFFNKNDESQKTQFSNIESYLSQASLETTTRLEELFNYPVTFSNFKVYKVELNELPLIIGKEDERTISVFINVEDTLPGKLIFLVSDISGENILRQLTGKDSVSLSDENGMLTEISRGCIENVAQIFISTFVSALSNLMNKTIMLSVPMISFSFKYSIINEIIFEKAETSDIIELFSAKFSIKKENIEGLFLFLPRDKING